MKTVTVLSSVSPTGVSSSWGANTGPLVPIGTSRPIDFATPASDASWPGAVVTQIALTPSRLNLAAAPDMSSSVALIFCSTTFRPCFSAAYLTPIRPPSPKSPSK